MKSTFWIYGLILWMGLGIVLAGCSSTIDAVEKTDRWLQEDVYQVM